MNRVLLRGAFISCLLAPCMAPAVFIDLYASGDASLTQVGTWAADDITLSYSVYQGSGDHAGFWLYTYCWDGETPGISHAIVQLTGNVLEEDLVLDSSSDTFAVGTYGPGLGGESSPGIPSTFWGVKFDNLSDQDECFSIVSDHIPVYGYFYAKGGGGKILGEAWATDILRPDGQHAPAAAVPDQASTVSALGFALLVLGGLRKRLGR